VAGVASDLVEAVERTGGLRVRLWPLLVAVSLVLLVGATAAVAALWLASGQVKTASYVVDGSPSGVQIRVVSGDVVLLGGAQGSVAVRRTDRSTFGHGPIEWRRMVGGRLEIASTCPRLVVGDCAASYRVAVPDNVPVSIRTDHGTIRVEGYRGSAALTTGTGAILVDAFCGYTLRATSARGDVSVVTSCAPQQLEAHSASGDVSVTVPVDHYRIDASAGGGPATVRGLTSDPNAPWEIQALSTSGDVTVQAGA